MKIVIISEGTPREKVVVFNVIKNFSEITLIKPTKATRNNSGNQSPAKRSENQNKAFKILNKYGNKFYFKFHKLLLEKNLKEFSLGELDINTIELPNNELKNENGIELLNSLKPDLILTCRAPILGPEILNIPKLGCINIHYGIPPAYRGNDTLFWPLFKKDFANIGGSIHYINSGVDTGNLLAIVYPPLEKNENELTIDIKTTKLLAKAVVEILKNIENSKKLPVGLKQMELGRNYKGKERTIWINLKYLAKLNFGLLKPMKRQESIDYFLDN